MQISVKRSGGFAGGSDDLGVIDTARPSAAAHEAEQIVRACQFFSLSDQASVGADMVHYEITVVDGEQRHTVAFDDDGRAENAALLDLVRLAEAAGQAG